MSGRKKVLEQLARNTVPFLFSADETLDVGGDLAMPVTDDYAMWSLLRYLIFNVQSTNLCIQGDKMSELVVFTFKTETGAKEMEDALIQMQKMKLIQLEDAAYVVRRQDGKVKVKQANNLVGAGAMGGAFWGMLIGLLFWAPWLGLAIGAITGAVAGGLTDVGVDDKFIKKVG